MDTLKQNPNSESLSHVAALLTSGLARAADYDVAGNDFKEILKMYGSDEVNEDLANKVKTMLRIKFNIFSDDLNIVYRQGDKSAIYLNKYVEVQIKEDDVRILNLDTRSQEGFFSGPKAKLQAEAELHNLGMIASIDQSARSFNARS